MTTEGGPGSGDNRLLAALKPSDWDLLAPHLNTTSFEQGAILREQGEEIEYVYFPLSGVVSLLAVTEAGNVIETATVGREGAIGVMADRDVTERSVVRQAGEFSRIPSTTLQNAMRDSATLRELMGRYNYMQFELVGLMAGCNTLHSARERLARWLLQASDRNESDVVISTNQELSEMFGVLLGSITTLVLELQLDGLIQSHRGRIVVVDRPRLQARACGCYGVARRKIECVFA